MNKEQLQKILGDRHIIAENWQFRVETDCMLINGDGICVTIHEHGNGNYMVKYDAGDYLFLEMIKHNASGKRVAKAANRYSVSFNYSPSFYLSDVPQDQLLGAVQFVANASAYFLNSILER